MIYRILLFAICSSLCIGVLQAQDNTSPNDQDSSADQTEAREDAYRRRMELEGSRDQDTFANTTYTSQARQEKIDKLPKESRDNIREQLTDIIIENGQWEPFDALRDYPYEPSETAQEDPGLRDREQEAWAEQMEKYHKREANAYGASRPSMPASAPQNAGESSDSDGQQGDGQQSDGQGQQGESEDNGEEAQQGENQGDEGKSQGQEGQEGSAGSSSSSASSYDPYQPQQGDDSDEISTAGVSESALDFLRAKQQQGSSSAGQAGNAEDAMEQQEMLAQTEDNTAAGANHQAAAPQQSNEDSQQSSESEIIIPGILAIEDLDKLEGIAEPEDDAENR